MVLRGWHKGWEVGDKVGWFGGGVGVDDVQCLARVGKIGEVCGCMELGNMWQRVREGWGGASLGGRCQAIERVGDWGRGPDETRRDPRVRAAKNEEVWLGFYVLV